MESIVAAIAHHVLDAFWIFFLITPDTVKKPLSLSYRGTECQKGRKKMECESIFLSVQSYNSFLLL